MAGTRFLVAGAVLYAIARLFGAPKPERAEWRPAAIVGLFLLLGGNGGVVLAQKTVPSGLAALLVAGTAIWMTIFGALLPGGTWPRWPAWIGLLGGLAGVALLIGPWGTGRIEPFGAGCLLAATLAWSIGSIYAKGARLPKSPFVATAVEMMAGGVALLVVGAAIGQFRGFDVRAVSAASILASVYLAVFGSIVAFTAYVWLLSVRPPSQVATYAYVNPVVAVVLGWYFLDEQLTTRMFAAAGAIVASVALITTFSKPVRDVEVPNEQCA
jgi:drug/metabolite transporter (DMT)-like permease